MPVIEIESLDDRRIDAFRDLLRSKLPKDAGLFITEGALLAERLLASDVEVVSLLVDPQRLSMFADSVEEHVPVYVADKQLLQQIVGFRFHRGILACGRRRERTSVDQVAADLPARSTVVACHEIQDPANLGGVLRNCAAFGVNAMLMIRLSNKCWRGSPRPACSLR